jgi:hypothetical protein
LADLIVNAEALIIWAGIIGEVSINDKILVSHDFVEGTHG